MQCNNYTASVQCTKQAQHMFTVQMAASPNVRPINREICSLPITLAMNDKEKGAERGNRRRADDVYLTPSPPPHPTSTPTPTLTHLLSCPPHPRLISVDGPHGSGPIKAHYPTEGTGEDRTIDPAGGVGRPISHLLAPSSGGLTFPISLPKFGSDIDSCRKTKGGLCVSIW